MIIKSMSRKQPSFDQLLAYIQRDEGQDAFAIRHNVMGRDYDRIRAEFERNGDLLPKRKNGVFLYHEILSITRAQGLSEEQQKRRLQEIAREYIAARCPENMVFGGLHQDKNHSFHYHLMISSNRAGEEKRQRLSKAQFRQIQVQLENHVLQKYPELEQKVAMNKRSERKLSRKETELERRTGTRSKRDAIRDRVDAAFGASMDRDSLLSAFGRENLELYVRGNTLGVIDHETGKKHRLKTLDLELADKVALRMEDVEPVRQSEKAEKMPADEKEKEGQRDKAELKREPEPYSRDDEDMKRDREDGLKKSNPERQELIDKGHVQPDPERDLMSHEDWRKQDTAAEKMRQSWRRTLDDFRGRTKDLQEKSQDRDGKGQSR